MDIGRAFAYPFEDEDWLKKMLIGAVLNLVPVVNLIPTGYGLRQMKNVSQGQDLPLPEWDDWGGDFVKGLLVFLAGLVYTLPIWLLQLPMLLVNLLAGNGEAGAVFAGICAAGVTCLTLLYALAMAIWMPAAIMQYVKGDTFGSFFQFADIWAAITTNTSDYFAAWLVYLLAGIIAGIVGSIVCGIGLLFTGFWSTLVMAKLFGDLMRPGDPASVEPLQPLANEPF